MIKISRFCIVLSLSLFLAQACWAKEGKDKSKKWDVASPPGPQKEIQIDVKSSTWTSLDLSPDGQTIVFDMLGDLFLLDIGGGQARVLTSGVEWDMQPAFSPDGRKIAFTSDRGGGDNIWILDLAKGETSATPVSQEKFRLLNQPVWDPSGPYIAARKHFTSSRSLGAGEIWAYHTSGSRGVQLTKRDNDQLDLGEPAYSPGGRFVYYSHDATPGPRFKYNKDPNAGIYAIERLDRETGEIERVAGGSGGALCPTPSPDGKSLAFVRRIRGKTVLMLKDLNSGAERQLFDGLDRDMQETWAIHGVYPDMAWTPDSQQIVFWAQGRIWKLAVSGGAPQEIAFRVKSQHKVAKAVRYPFKVAPEVFTNKAIRSIQLAPDGNNVIFSAMGKLWSSSLREPNTAQRVTASVGGTETSPKLLSAQSLLYCHWDDQALGSIRRRNLATGTEQVLVENGRFADPALSPDGRYLVYKKLSKSSLFDSRFTSGGGLYVKDLRSSSPAYKLGPGREPHFGKSSHVVFYTKDSKSTELLRYDLEKRSQRVLFRGKNLTNISLSPNGHRGVFIENFQAYTFPVTLTGRTVALSGGSKALPVEKVSKAEGAYFPSWSANGTLIWNVGPHLWTLNSSATKANKTTLNIRHRADQPGDSSVVALVGGRVVTMKGDEVLNNATVLIKNDRIVSVGQNVVVPAGAKTIDCRGKTVLPGLVDVHWHGSFSDEEVFPEVNYTALSSLSFGVTTLHDPSNDTASVFTAKEMQRVGRLLAPRIFSTGTILYGAKAPGYYAPINSLKDAKGHLKRLKAWGARSVKSYNQPRRDQRQQVIQAARETEMMVVPEGGSLLQHNLTMVVDGHTGVEHALPVAEVYEDIVSLWSQTDVGYTPTLGVAYGGVWGENFWYVETDVWDDERLNRFVPREVLDPAARRRMKAPSEEYNHKKASAVAHKLSKSGVKVNLGAHGQREGLAAHWELWMFVQGGMTPHQALRNGTLNGARYLGMDGDIGSLESGKLADVIVVDGNPLEDIRLSKKVAYTVLGGRVYDSSTMKQIAPRSGAEPKLWWRK